LDADSQHRVFRAAFAIIDPMMATWHALRLTVAWLPPCRPRATLARTALLGPDEVEAVCFSASRAPAPIFRRIAAQLSQKV
jgi:hypothetical protein